MKNTTILSIDPAIRVTGYSVLKVIDNIPKITNYSVIDTTKLNSKSTLKARVDFIVSRFAVLTKNFNDNLTVAIEYPAGASHGSKGGIGRAVKIYPVFASAFTMYGYCFTRSIPCQLLLPREWQPEMLGNYTEENVKIASMNNANKILSDMRLKNRLKTKKDENIADAINIAYKVYLSLKD